MILWFYSVILSPLWFKKPDQHSPRDWFYCKLHVWSLLKMSSGNYWAPSTSTHYSVCQAGMWNFPGRHCNTKCTSGWVQSGFLSSALAAELALQVRLEQHCSVCSTAASAKWWMKDRANTNTVILLPTSFAFWKTGSMPNYLTVLWLKQENPACYKWRSVQLNTLATEELPTLELPLSMMSQRICLLTVSCI